MAEKKLKTVVTAETSDFKKGMRESKAALADFQKQGERSLSAIASNLGGASGALGSLSGNITNATNLFRGLFRQSEAGLTTMRSSIAAVGGALAGLGITAVITAFQELNREAKSFETRLQGVNLAASAKAYRETYRQALDESVVLLFCIFETIFGVEIMTTFVKNQIINQIQPVKKNETSIVSIITPDDCNADLDCGNL